MAEEQVYQLRAMQDEFESIKHWVTLSGDHAEKVIAFSKTLPPELQCTLWEALNYVARVARNIQGSGVIGYDFAPHSLGFSIQRASGDRLVCGGIIFHGAHDGGGDGGAPTYSVCLTPQVGWQIHT